MATSSYIQNLVGSLDAPLKKALIAIFDYVLKDIRWGRPGHQEAAVNLQATFIQGTTPAVANQEFSIEHGMGTTPYLLIPVLDLQTVSSSVVRLTVARAPDVRRVYLKSPDTSAPFTALCEG